MIWKRSLYLSLLSQRTEIQFPTKVTKTRTQSAENIQKDSGLTKQQENFAVFV